METRRMIVKKLVLLGGTFSKVESNGLFGVGEQVEFLSLYVWVHESLIGCILKFKTV